MKKAIVAGLVGILTLAGCAKKEISISQKMDPADSLKADISINIGATGKFFEPTLVINDNNYLFVSRDKGYDLVRLASGQEPTSFVVKIDNPNHEQSFTMNLHDGKRYNLAYDSQKEDYTLTHE